MNAPCRECENREQGCHSRCDLYAEFRKRVDGVKAERERERASTPEFARDVVRQIWREMRGR